MTEPIIYTVRRDPMEARGFFPANSGADLSDKEDWTRLGGPAIPHGEVESGLVLNEAFPDVAARTQAFLDTIRKPRLRLTLVGLGDVGGTLLTALKLLSGLSVGTDPDETGKKGGCGHPPLQGVPEIAEIGIYDPNEALCRRWELELNQILDRPEPRIVLRSPDALFDCDVFLFTASRGVPPLGASGDVRMAQLEANREMLKPYAALARASRFSGLFCQISDPVDLLARCVFLQSNRDETGSCDFRGLLPEQIVGFGLGVMQARAAYMARRLGADCPRLRTYGPHGAELIVANDPVDYDAELSAELTRRTVGANLEVRALGFKPYVAPAISSAALSILSLLRGEPFLGAVPMGGVYFGCRSRLTDRGFVPVREDLHPALEARLEKAWKKLREAEPLCGI